MLVRTLVVLGIGSLSSMCVAAAATGCVHGRTVDGSGGVVGLATISVLGGDGGKVHSASSGADGKFQVCGLSAGNYRVMASAAGYENGAQNASLADGQDVQVEIKLQATKTSERASGLSNGAEEQTQEFHAADAVLKHVDVPDAPSAAKARNLHGELSGQLGASQVGATDVAAENLLPVSQFSGSIGGTLGSGRTTYFTSYERSGMDRQQLMAALARRVDFGDTGLLSDGRVLASSAFTVRMDHRFSAHDAGYLRFGRDEMHGNSLLAGQDGRLPQGATGLNATQTRLVAANTVELSPRTQNETRAELVISDVKLPGGAEAAGMQSVLPTERRNRVFQAADNVYRQVAGQSVRLGGDFLYNQMNISLLQANLGRMSGGGASIGQSAVDAGLYLQGQRQLHTGLQMTTGMRYDLQPMRGMRTDLNNFAPQLGFAWSPGSARTVLRAGFGMSYERIPLPAFAGSDEPGVAANLTRSASISNAGGLADGVASFETLSPTVQNSYAQQASVEAEQQIGKKSFLSGQYQYVRGVQLALPVSRTATLCASTHACTTQNEFAGQQVGTGSVSTYNGMTVAFTQQPVRWGNYKVAYTYSTAEGAGTGLNASYVSDAMRRVSFTGVLHTSLDPSSTVWQHLSRGFVLSGTTDSMTRSEFAGMNFVHTNARLTKNLAVGARFRLEGFVETFHTLERTNASFAKAAAEMGSSASEVFHAYETVAAVQSPGGGRAGLQMSF